MKRVLSKKEALVEIDEFFGTDTFDAEGVRKIKRIAMRHRIKLGKHRARFCKRCLKPLMGKTRVTGKNKTVVCSCGYTNRIKLS